MIWLTYVAENGCVNQNISSLESSLTSDGCSASVLCKAEGGEKETLPWLLFSAFAKTTGFLCFKALLAPCSVFSVHRLLSWLIEFNILTCILPNSQKVDCSVKAVLAESVPPNAELQRAVDTLWEIPSSVCRQPCLTNFMFQSTSFHLYSNRLDTQTGT